MGKFASTLARYELEPDGAIHHWLACGPATRPLTGLDRVINPRGSPFVPGGRWAISNAPDSLHLKRRVYRSLPAPAAPPRLRPALGRRGPVAGQAWRYAAAEEDHLIDFSLFTFLPTYMGAWLFGCLESSKECRVDAELLTIGPAQVWLKGKLVARHIDFGYVEPARVPLCLPLAPALNDLWVHGEMIAWREAPLGLGLRLVGHPPLAIRLPLGRVPPPRWHRAESDLVHVQARQFTFPRPPIRIWLAREAPSPLKARVEIGPPRREGALGGQRPRLRATLTLRPGCASSVHVPAPDGRSSRQVASRSVDRGRRRLGDDELWARLTGDSSISLTLHPLDGTPLIRRFGLYIPRADFRHQPYGRYSDRCREALEHLAERPDQVLGAMAAVEIGRARMIHPDAVALACQFLEQRYDCADFYGLSLLVLLNRFGASAAIRPVDRRRIEAAFRGAKFWIDEPGVDAMCFHTENHQILFHAMQYLAGQRWPRQVFSNSDGTGEALMKRARPRIRDWILRRLRSGFSEWDSNTYLALDTFAMLALVEGAGSPRLRELATAMLHKIFFMLACQSWRGIHGCSHGRTYVESLKTARVENTSGLQRIAWGLGTWGGETRATGLLAMARRYRVPAILRAIGADLPDRLVTMARSAGEYRPRFDLRGGSWGVNTVTVRTPDGMLSAAVGHRPGAVGIQEHLWQATLGPEAVVFTTYPANSQEHGHARPNFWAGSARLPSVTLAHDAVLCLYDLSRGGGLPFTHAYFPTTVFDEYAIAGPWVFGRVGNGYVALAGDGDLTLTSSGPHAGQEVRSAGGGWAWVCRIGRAATDGEFASFCRSVHPSVPCMNGPRIAWRTPEGPTLSFTWEGPLRIDGSSQALRDFPHYDNLYTHTPFGADRMVIRHADGALVLDLWTGRCLPETPTALSATRRA